MKIETWFEIRDGQELWHNLPEVKNKRKNLKEGTYTYTIERVEDQQSREQNNSRWAIPYMFFRKVLIDTGNLLPTASKTDVHEWCMVNYLPNDYRERIYEEWKLKLGMINLKTGEVYKTPFRLTTIRMRKLDANNYYQAMQDGYAETFSSGEPNDLIPDPDKDYKKKNNAVL